MNEVKEGFFSNESYLACSIAVGSDSVKRKKLIVQAQEKALTSTWVLDASEELASDKKQKLLPS